MLFVLVVALLCHRWSVAIAAGTGQKVALLAHELFAGFAATPVACQVALQQDIVGWTIAGEAFVYFALFCVGSFAFSLLPFL